MPNYSIDEHCWRRHVRLVALVVIALGLVVGCGKNYSDSTYRVTSMQGGRTCLALVKGTDDKTVCDQFTRVVATRALRVNDCVVLRLYPETSGKSELIRKPQAACT